MTTQAHPPSEAQQLHDARIANDQLRVRLAEQEALVAQERARADGDIDFAGDRYRKDDGGLCPAALAVVMLLRWSNVLLPMFGGGG
jgi:hypothetical protein